MQGITRAENSLKQSFAEIVDRTTIELNRYARKHMTIDNVINNSNLFSKVFEKTYHGNCECDYEDHKFYVTFIINWYLKKLTKEARNTTKDVEDNFISSGF